MSYSSLCLSFDLKRHRITIYRSVLSHLKDPSHVDFLYDEDRNILVITASTTKTTTTFAVPKRVYSEGKFQCVIYRRAFTESLQKRLNWENGELYRVLGNYSPELNVIAFELNKAEKVDGVEFSITD